MNIREALLKEHSKAQTESIVFYIGADETKFAELMKLFFGDDEILKQRSAWCVSYCIIAHHQLAIPYLGKMIALLQKDVHNAVKRNIVRSLQYIKIPKKHFGKTANACFDLLLSKKEPIAVKAFAMTVLANICRDEPDLKNELKIILNDQLPYGSAGFKSRAQKILMEIEN